jgi:hypothetical protein
LVEKALTELIVLKKRQLGDDVGTVGRKPAGGRDSSAAGAAGGPELAGFNVLRPSGDDPGPYVPRSATPTRTTELDQSPRERSYVSVRR